MPFPSPLNKVARYTARALVLTCLLQPALVLVIGCSKDRNPQPTRIFQQDLHAFGYVTEEHGQLHASYPVLTFLSEDLLLVLINVEKLDSTGASLSPGDQPPSELLIFNVNEHKLLVRSQIPVSKQRNALQATGNGRFVILNESGILLCLETLQCGSPVQAPRASALFVSPKGTRLLLNGNMYDGQELFDTAALQKLDQIPSDNPRVMPGDAGLLVWPADSQNHMRLYVRFPGKPDVLLGFTGGITSPYGRFLNDTTVASQESDTILAVAKVDATVMYRMPVHPFWDGTEVLPSASGNRFCINEGGYTRWNSIMNIWDIDNARPWNVQRVRVIETASGRVLLDRTWDPRPFVGFEPSPALSPSGNKLAIIRSGVLEILDVP